MEGKLQSSKRVVRKRRWPHRRTAPAEVAADLHTLIRVRSRRLLTGPGCALVERRSGTSRRGAAASGRSPGARREAGRAEGLERLLAAARRPRGGLLPSIPARESTGSLRGWWPAGLHFLTCSGGGAEA